MLQTWKESTNMVSNTTQYPTDWLPTRSRYNRRLSFYCLHCGWRFCCQLKPSVSALLHWLTILILLTCSALSGVT